SPAAQALIAEALQSALEGRVALTAEYTIVADSFEWNDAEAATVAELQIARTVDDYFGLAKIPPERARAILAGLLLLGLAEAPLGDFEEPAPPARAPAPADDLPLLDPSQPLDREPRRVTNEPPRREAPRHEVVAEPDPS